MLNMDFISLVKLKKKYKTVYVYGAGHYFAVLQNYWENESRNIDAIIISELTSEKQKNIGNIQIKSFDEIKYNLSEEVAIIFAMKLQTAEDIIDKNGKFLDRCNLITISDELFEKILVSLSNRDTIRYYDKLIKENEGFKYVEIETINRCNGTCNFCPVNAKAPQRPYSKMSKELFESIICQLEAMNYSKQIALFSNNEPFLDERIVGFAKYAREHLPKAYIYLFTNARLLSVEKYLDIMKYLDFLQIDLYLDEGEECPSNITEILNIAKQEKLEQKTGFFSISSNAIRFSRGGNSPNSQVSYITNELCRLPLLQIVIRPDGKISLCCNDALGQMTLGDLKTETISEIWSSDTRRSVQRDIVKGRKYVPLCRYCNSVDRRDFDGAPYE